MSCYLRLEESDNVGDLGPDGSVGVTLSGESTEKSTGNGDISESDTVTDQVSLVLEVLVQDSQSGLELLGERGVGRLGVSEVTSNHAGHGTVVGGDLRVGEGGPLSDLSSNGLVGGQELSLGSSHGT
jgi:hypothetical protein